MSATVSPTRTKKFRKIGEISQYSDTRIAWQPGSASETPRPPRTKEELEEHIRCAASPIYFITNYCYILDPIKGRIPFKLYAFQRITLKMFLLYVFNIVLKPRQMGLSWLVSCFALWMASFRSNQNIVVISIKEDVAKRFMDKIQYTHKQLPGWLKGDVTNKNTSTITWSNNSRIESIPTSEDAGRSEGISLLIIDEAAFVRFIEKIWAAAFPTLSTGGMAILLSTANGLGNFFANKWRDAIAKESDFNPIQLHWKMHPDRDLAWYDIQRRELGPALCAQEVDCDFLNSGRPVFDTGILVEWSEILRKVKPIEVLYSPDERMVNPYDKKSEGLYIFAQPVPGRRYVIGGDPSSGDGSDFGGIQVLDWATGVQVAEMRVNCKPNIFANYLFGIGKLYNWACVAPERNGLGLAVVQKLMELNYPDIYKYVVEEAKIDKEVSSKRMATEETFQLGFTTTASNRPVIIAHGEAMIRDFQTERDVGTLSNKLLLVNGMRTLNEMIVFNYQETGKPNPRANTGYNDDLVMAWLIAQHARIRYKPTQAMPVHFL